MIERWKILYSLECVAMSGFQSCFSFLLPLRQVEFQNSNLVPWLFNYIKAFGAAGSKALSSVEARRFKLLSWSSKRKHNSFRKSGWYFLFCQGFSLYCILYCVLNGLGNISYLDSYITKYVRSMAFRKWNCWVNYIS